MVSKKSVIKGGEVGSVKEAKKAVKSRGGGGFMKRIPADGINVRFLTEPDGWFKYFEHYDDTREGDYNFPCTEDCDACDEGIRASKRFLVNALDLDDNKVVPLVLPASIASDLLKKYDKFKTLMDRDYELSKEGTGLDTEYDQTYEAPKKRNLSRYDLLDLGEILQNALDGVDEDEDEDEEDEKPRRTKSRSAKSNRRSRDEDDDYDEDDDEDDEDERPARKRTAVKKTAAKRTAAKRTASSSSRTKRSTGKTLSKRK